MCGLCGIVQTSSTTPVSRDLLESMARTMRHRGPDAEGYTVQGRAGLGFQRLAIIDLSGSTQPMSNEDDSLWIAFNGEIYNFQSLREELIATGRHTFKSHGDTEVILHLYEEYGERCVEHLRGMFAFAIWDRRKETLFIARDRLGKKPLVYTETPEGFLFASEMKALLKHPAVRREVDPQAVDLYLTYQYIPSPWTIFKSIRKLPPAHTLTLKDGRVTIRRYWEPTPTPKTTMSFSEASEHMMAKLREATRLRMIADVPLGAFLSGGIDSSVVVGLMSELSKTPVKTFSIGFEEDTFSELPYARQVAKRFGTDHQEFIVKPDAVELLPTLAWHYGEPYADSSALPSYYVSQMTRKHVTVALNGDGGDETMAGYPRYQAMKFMRWWSRVPRPVRLGFLKSLSLLPDGHPPLSLSWRLKRLFSLGMADPTTTYLDTLCYFQEDQKAALYSPGFKNQLTAEKFTAPSYLAGLLARYESVPGIDKYLSVDQMSYLPECLMVKMDIASMANSLETRSPFLDHEFIDLVAKFPESWKLHGLFQKKYILRQALKGWLPDEILNRRKQGFAIPMSHWFRGPLSKYVEDILLSTPSTSRGWFETSEVRRLIEEHRSGKSNHSYRLWALLMFEHWYRTYMDHA